MKRFERKLWKSAQPGPNDDDSYKDVYSDEKVCVCNNFFSLTKTLCYQCNIVNMTCSLKSISSCMLMALQCAVMSSPFG